MLDSITIPPALDLQSAELVEVIGLPKLFRCLKIFAWSVEPTEPIIFDPVVAGGRVYLLKILTRKYIGPLCDHSPSLMAKPTLIAVLWFRDYPVLEEAATYNEMTPTKSVTKQVTTEESEEDPVEVMLKRTGCINLHYKVQECIASTQDWRKCQVEVQEFRACMAEYGKSKQQQEEQKK